MISQYDLIELSRHLKQERLFISAEKEQLQTLNEHVAHSAQKLYHLAWIARQQRCSLDQLILANKDVTPQICCQRTNTLESTNFVDGYKSLSYHESQVGEFLKRLRETPKVVAACLVHAEKTSQEMLHHVAHIFVTGVYGNMVMPEDEAYTLRVLKCLIEEMLVLHDDPRRLLRKQTCAFSVVFKLLNDSLFSAKLFLTAALHKPVMQLLMEDEWFYDIDPQRALYRFPTAERVKRFGQPGTADYEAKTKHYREVTSAKLATLASRFVESINSNMYCFPASLSWLISQLYHILTKVGQVTSAEARAMCTDLVFACFICPAICDPEPFGITSDAPISYIARHNLMQVAQILQVLALSSWDEGESKTQDLYGKFEKNSMAFLLDTLLESPLSDHPPQPSSHLAGCCRAAVLLTPQELLQLVNLLQSMIGSLEEGCTERKQLEAMLSSMPPLSVIQGLQPTPTPSLTPTPTPQSTPPGTPSSAKKINKALREKKRLLLGPDSPSVADSGIDSTDAPPPQSQQDEVMVVSLGVTNECPGMLSEQKVLEQESKQRKFNSLIPGEDDPISESDIPLHEKRTRFSLSHDQDSIATSDNLEAISEAASSHSVTSDLDNENDNFSDMMSANVSGRGTPSISGRDTPISQVDSQLNGEGHEQHDNSAPNLPVTVQKTNREDVTDRFGKFEIKQELERDETKSTVSDTWSTDVLGSDSEPPEQTQFERLTEVAEEMARQNLLGVQELMFQVSELSETTSDAWSTDVMASDTSERQLDRLMELDQDDMASVSSRSVAQDSEIGEQLEQGEDTPQASGRQSPREETEKSEGFVRTLPSRVGTSAAAGVGGSPDDPNSVFLGERRRPFDRFSDADCRFGSREGFRTLGPDADDIQRPLSDPHSKYGYGVASRAVPCKFNGGRMNNVLQAFDPLSVSKDKDKDTATEYSYSSSVPSVASDVSFGDGDKDNQLDTASTSSQPCAVKDSSTMMDLSSHVSTLKQESSPVLQNGNDDMEGIITGFSEGFKLTEQQNVNLDAHRLSGTISLFDPLLDESSTDPVDLEDMSAGFRPVSAPVCPNAQTSLFSGRASYQDMGARPKTATALPAFGSGDAGLNTVAMSIPKITLASQASIEKCASGDGYSSSGSKSKLPQPNGTSQDADGYVVIDSDFGENNDIKPVVVGNGSVVMTAAAAGSEGLQKTRGSTGSSSSSSLVELGSAMGSSGSQDDEKKGDKKKGSSFFHSFKERLSKGGKRKGVGAKSFERDEAGNVNNRSSTLPHDSEGCRVPASSREAEDVAIYSPGGAGSDTNLESSDDILAKYRKSTSIVKPVETAKDKEICEQEPLEAAYDPNNLEHCKAFLDAKKKLRLVLSTSDFQAIPNLHVTAGGGRGGGSARENDLVAFLKVQLAEAINLQDKALVAQLHETVRCLRQFDNHETKKLLKTMKEEYRSRSPYIAYLVRCRQGLLSTLAHIDRLLNRVERDKSVCNRYFLCVFVRLFLEKRERSLHTFISDFQHLTLADEKTLLVERFLELLYKQLEEDADWQAASNTQRQEAKIYIERNMMSHIYTHAMYPNGDGDIMRDQILQEHMRKLSQVITPMHKDLRIPSMYRYECPWPAAQAEIYMINAYKTPKDKLQCVQRCCTTIMNLLSMANDKSVPAADDFMPVLIYVLLKANPPNLLSSIQYVGSFYEKRLSGEEMYWWMQFASAVEFIKTMDY